MLHHDIPPFDLAQGSKWFAALGSRLSLISSSGTVEFTLTSGIPPLQIQRSSDAMICLTPRRMSRGPRSTQMEDREGEVSSLAPWHPRHRLPQRSLGPERGQVER